MTPLEIVLWVVLPYAAIVTFLVGHVIRYRYDKFGWTSRASQTYGSRLLAWGSPLFHYGILMVFAGHVIGLLIPREWTAFFGIDEHAYHLLATWGGSIAAALTIAGLALLLFRRGTLKRMFRVTTGMDVLMYVLLAGTIAFGAIATVQHQVLGAGYEYRGTISPWIRSLLLFQPEPGLMAAVPLAFQLHVLSATALFAVWPFTRLVHVLSAPIGYLFRPYVVYRSRDRYLGARKPRPGWARAAHPPPQKARQR